VGAPPEKGCPSLNQYRKGTLISKRGSIGGKRKGGSGSGEGNRKPLLPLHRKEKIKFRRVKHKERGEKGAREDGREGKATSSKVGYLL